MGQYRELMFYAHLILTLLLMLGMVCHDCFVNSTGGKVKVTRGVAVVSTSHPFIIRPSSCVLVLCGFLWMLDNN